MSGEFMTSFGTIDKETFQKFAELIYEIAGIKLGHNKEALVTARISKRLRKLELNSFEEYYDLCRNDSAGAEIIELLNAISTNTTHFFREPRHFEILSSLLKKWEAEGQKKFRIWCAASSTGEEPYTLAMTMSEALSDLSDAKLLATDISTKVLSIAREGIYEDKHIDKTPPELIKKYFTTHKNTAKSLIQRTEHRGLPPEKVYKATESLKRLVQFGRLNLSTPPYPLKGPLDVVFCRNVMIYFDNEVRKRLLNEMFRLIKPGGYLMVGHSESLSGMLSNFKTVEPSVYIKE